MGGDPWIPGCIDPGADGRAHDDGRQLLQTYVKSGLKLVKAKNNVESGIEIVWEALSTGKVKIFKNLYQLRTELITYARDQQGRIIKTNDHLCDALRYLINTPHIAISRIKATQNGYTNTGRSFNF
jgi:hypothetical protein